MLIVGRVALWQCSFHFMTLCATGKEDFVDVRVETYWSGKSFQFFEMRFGNDLADAMFLTLDRPPFHQGNRKPTSPSFRVLSRLLFFEKYVADSQRHRVGLYTHVRHEFLHLCSLRVRKLLNCGPGTLTIAQRQHLV